MRILIVHNHYLQAGGEDEVVKSESAMLREYGHEVFTHARQNKEIESFPPLQKISFLLKDSSWSKDSYADVRKAIKDSRPDIAHIHNTFFMLSPSVYQACYDERVPVVQTLHNYRFLCPIGVFYRNGRICEDCLTRGRQSVVVNRCWKESFALSVMLKCIVDQFYKRKILTDLIEHFIVLSEFSKGKYTENGFPEGKFTVKPNFVNLIATPRESSGEYALYVGGLQPYKGIGTLIKAWDKLSTKLSLKIIGDGPLKNQLPLNSKNIQWLGHKPLEDVIHYIKRARFVVFPSECYENFPRIIVEAFACGVGVIASRLGVARELIVEGKTGLLFEAGNADDLALKAIQLIDNPPLLRRLGENACREFTDKYTQEKNYPILMNVYHKAIEGYRKEGLR